MSPHITRYIGCIIALAAFVWLSPLCIFKCVLEWPAGEDAKSHWLHLFDFSPLCIFKCFLKWPACEQAVTFVICQSPKQPLCFLFVHFKIPGFSQIFATQVACFQRYIMWIFRFLSSEKNVQKIHHIKSFVHYKIPGFLQLFATQVACFQFYKYHVNLQITHSQGIKIFHKSTISKQRKY